MVFGIFLWERKNSIIKQSKEFIRTMVNTLETKKQRP
jgi:hypothetical protein